MDGNRSQTVHRYDIFESVRLRGEAKKARWDSWFEYWQTGELSMVDRYRDEIVPSTAYMHAPLEDDAPYLLHGGVAAATILSILSDHRSVCEREKEAVRTTSHNLICRPFPPPHI